MGIPNQGRVSRDKASLARALAGNEDPFLYRMAAQMYDSKWRKTVPKYKAPEPVSGEINGR